MEELEKRTTISENRILIYRTVEGYIKPTYVISEGFFENGEILKTYDLSQWDDYGLNAWTDDENVSKISFEFDINHPLYLPLFHLLNYDKELLIDDDDTIEDNKKYMLISRKDNKIYIDFVDNENYDYSSEKFHVFIKNICFDGRSKIDRYNKDTKKRLHLFFNEVNKILTSDTHQISVEEIMINNTNDYEIDKMKKVFKRNI